MALALARLGNVPDDITQRLEREPKNPRTWLFEAMVQLIQGRAADSERSIERSTQLIPETLDAVESPAYASLGAVNGDYAGEKDRALAEYTRLLRDPGSILNVYQMKHDAHGKLHGDPRLEALLDDPANNAPLF